MSEVRRQTIHKVFDGCLAGQSTRLCADTSELGMRNKIQKLILSLNFMICAPLYSAEVTQELAKPVPTCYSMTTNAVRILPDLFEVGNKKDIATLLVEWQKFCDPARNEYLLRTLILNDLLNDREPELHETELNAFLFFQRSFSADGYLQGRSGNEQVGSAHAAYTRYTIEMAKRNLASSGRKVSPYYSYYSGNFSSFHDEVRRDQTSPVGRVFQANRETLRSMNVLPLGVYTGAWQPVGSNNILGLHPLIGTYIGWGNYRWEVVANIHFRFLDSPNEIATVYQNKLINTKHFFGGYIGLDVAYNIVTERRYDIAIKIGFAFDGFDVVSSDRNAGKEGQSINSLNVNLGTVYRYYFSDERSDYLFVSGQLNYLDYQNPGGTNLAGGAISLYAGYGSAFSVPRAARSKEIGGI